MTPNLSKILYHWGLEKDVRQIGVKSTGVNLMLRMCLLLFATALSHVAGRRDGGEIGYAHMGYRNAGGVARRFHLYSGEFCCVNESGCDSDAFVSMQISGNFYTTSLWRMAPKFDWVPKSLELIPRKGKSGCQPAKF